MEKNTIVELYDALFISLETCSKSFMIYKDGLVKVFNRYEQYEINCTKINYYKKEGMFEFFTSKEKKTVNAYWDYINTDLNLIPLALEQYSKKCEIEINVYEKRNLISSLLSLFNSNRESGVLEKIEKKIYFSTYVATMESHAESDMINYLKEYFVNERKDIPPHYLYYVISALNDAEKALQKSQKLNGKISTSSLGKSDVILRIKQYLFEGEDPKDVINETIELLETRNVASNEIEKFKIECDKLSRTVILLSNRILCRANHKTLNILGNNELIGGIFDVLSATRRFHLYIFAENLGNLLTEINF